MCGRHQATKYARGWVRGVKDGNARVHGASSELTEAQTDRRGGGGGGNRAGLIRFCYCRRGKVFMVTIIGLNQCGKKGIPENCDAIISA